MRQFPDRSQLVVKKFASLVQVGLAIQGWFRRTKDLFLLLAPNLRPDQIAVETFESGGFPQPRCRRSAVRG